MLAFHLDTPFPKDHTISALFKSAHSYSAISLFIPAGLQASAALWRQGVLKEDVLVRMLPRLNA